MVTTDHAREAAEKIVARFNGATMDDVEKAAKDVQAAIDAACAEKDEQLGYWRYALELCERRAQLRKAGVVLADDD